MGLKSVIVQEMINDCTLQLMKGIDYWDINQLSGSEEVANHKKKKKTNMQGEKNIQHIGMSRSQQVPSAIMLSLRGSELNTTSYDPPRSDSGG